MVDGALQKPPSAILANDVFEAEYGGVCANFVERVPKWIVCVYVVVDGEES